MGAAVKASGGIALLCVLSPTAFNCGGGARESIPAPAAPAVPTAPEPPPEPPSQVTGVEAAEIGQDYILWTWDPVEAATGYEAGPALVGTPPDERVIESVEETSFLAGGFEPGSAVMIHVRAVTETAGGRAAGPWSNQVVAETWGEPRECGDEREHALAFGARGTALVKEWDGAPFRFYFNLVGLDEDDPRGADGRTQLEEAQFALDVVGRLSERIEDQLGYPIIEVGGFIRDERIRFSNHCDWRAKGQIVGMVVPESRSDYIRPGGYARPQCALWGSMGYLGLHDAGVVHEVFHNFGFKHHWNDPLGLGPTRGEGVGVWMSELLTAVYGRVPSGNLGVTFEDIDALRCIFPEGG